MKSILDYSELIKEIPVNNQSTKIKKEVWERINYPKKQIIENSIFSTSTEVELSRMQVKNETNIRKKIIMILMWGYPTGGRGNNIEKLLKDFDKLEQIFSKYKNINLEKKEFMDIVSLFNSIKGLGISTWTKFLYFFDISVDSLKCEIFDLKILESLNKKQFSEINEKNWIQDVDNYFDYLILLNSISKKIIAEPDQVEIFLFYFNLYYKF